MQLFVIPHKIIKLVDILNKRHQDKKIELPPPLKTEVNLNSPSLYLDIVRCIF